MVQLQAEIDLFPRRPQSAPFHHFRNPTLCRAIASLAVNIPSKSTIGKNIFPPRQTFACSLAAQAPAPELFLTPQPRSLHQMAPFPGNQPSSIRSEDLPRAAMSPIARHPGRADDPSSHTTSAPLHRQLEAHTVTTHGCRCQPRYQDGEPTTGSTPQAHLPGRFHPLAQNNDNRLPGSDMAATAGRLTSDTGPSPATGGPAFTNAGMSGALGPARDNGFAPGFHPTHHTQANGAVPGCCGPLRSSSSLGPACPSVLG